MAITVTTINAHIDWKTGLVTLSGSNGYVIDRYPVPEPLVRAKRDLDRANLGLWINRRCHKLAARQARRRR